MEKGVEFDRDNGNLYYMGHLNRVGEWVPRREGAE